MRAFLPGPLQAAARCAGSLDGEGPVPFFLSTSEEIRVMTSPTGSGSTKVITVFTKGLSYICLNCRQSLGVKQDRRIPDS